MYKFRLKSVFVLIAKFKKEIQSTAMSAFPEAPPNLKAIQPYLKIASEHDARDFVGELDG